MFGLIALVCLAFMFIQVFGLFSACVIGIYASWRSPIYWIIGLASCFVVFGALGTTEITSDHGGEYGNFADFTSGVFTLKGLGALFLAAFSIDIATRWTKGKALSGIAWGGFLWFTTYSLKLLHHVGWA